MNTIRYKKWPDEIKKALDLPSGSKYFRCALQVNPYNYLKDNRGKKHGLSEEEYNDQLINKYNELQIKVIAVTDHNHVEAINEIKKSAEPFGITVLSGFEVSSSEGVHILCIFNQDKKNDVLEKHLGALGIHTTSPSTKNSTESFSNILYKVQKEWDGICIAAHVTNNGGGLLTIGASCCKGHVIPLR